MSRDSALWWREGQDEGQCVCVCVWVSECVRGGRCCRRLSKNKVTRLYQDSSLFSFPSFSSQTSSEETAVVFSPSLIAPPFPAHQCPHYKWLTHWAAAGAVPVTNTWCCCCMERTQFILFDWRKHTGCHRLSPPVPFQSVRLHYDTLSRSVM